MYDVNEVFERMRAHQVPLVVLGLITMISALAWYVESVRLARRDQVISMPMMATFGWFGHDVSYVLGFDRWFTEYGFWFFEGFWCFMVPLVVMEVIWIGQILRYGRQEYAPTLRPATWTVGVLAATACGAGTWIGMKAGLGDPLYILSMHLTVALYGAGGVMLTLRRGSRLGQSMLQWSACLVMFVTWSITTILFLGPPFRDWRWITLSVAITVWVAGAMVLLQCMPARSAQVASDDRAAEGVAALTE